MLPLDDGQLYVLSEAARRLFCGPAWLARQARRRQVPWTWKAGSMAFPRAWVDAAAGTTAADAEGLKAYWLERLAPPAPDATRPLRDRRSLEADELLEAGEAARQVTADALYLRRLAEEGTLPALRIDGGLCFDASLTELVGAEDGADPSLLAARRDAVAGWTRYEYAEGVDSGAPPPASASRPAAAPTVAAAPRAWHLPDDLLDEDAAPTTDEEPADGGLAQAEGYETIDEDD